MAESPNPRSSLPNAPPEAWEPLIRVARLAARPLERFLGIQAASGIVLLAAAAIALLWANSAWAASYHQLWHTPISLGIGSWNVARPLEWWVNDGLMVIFFFVVGLEIRREIHHGELSELRRAALPAVAALGGMIAPALLYLAVAGGPATRHGWGVPMATDIAFAVGILALLGDRVPAALRVLLLALAVIDDLGAIVVIAAAYSSGVTVAGFGIAAGGVAIIVAMQRFGVRAKLAYLAPALGVWGGVVVSGVHPTIAGVVVGLLTPVRAWLGPDGFQVGVQRELDRIGADGQDLALTLRHVDDARREAMSPAESLIEALHPWVAYAIMPLFALANAGVPLGGRLDGAASTVALGTVLGLTFGKPIGILGAIYGAKKLGILKLPKGLGAPHLWVLGAVAGVGFTMALFVAPLAFSQASSLAGAKVGVLAGSAASAILAIVLGRTLLQKSPSNDAAKTADEAESSTDQ